MEHCIEILARRYPQILLPCEKGIKDTEEYKNVCLRGEKCDRPITFTMDPQDKLETVKTPAGDVEVLSLYKREDFVHACRCLGNKCEPVDIPDSTGAMAEERLYSLSCIKTSLSYLYYIGFFEFLTNTF